MVMRVHDVLDRFVRNELVHFADHRKRTFFIERRFDDRCKVAEIDSETVMAPARNEPDSICQFLRLCALARRRCFLHGIRHGHGRDVDIGLDVVDGDLH